ncbi:hypothetical protein Bbelb_098430 [Branchiostoma belcheri]|nr:hypothetical protein Bbelb_098430 [Branchiostoma belcheri]
MSIAMTRSRIDAGLMDVMDPTGDTEERNHPSSFSAAFMSGSERPRGYYNCSISGSSTRQAHFSRRLEELRSRLLLPRRVLNLAEQRDDVAMMRPTVSEKNRSTESTPDNRIENRLSPDTTGTQSWTLGSHGDMESSLADCCPPETGKPAAE